MVAGQRIARRVVIPSVGIKIIVEIIFVSRAMPGIRAAPGNNLHLRARRTIEVSGLVGGVHFEFLNTVERSRHHASGSATDRI